MNKLNCITCGEEFLSVYNKAKYCPYCRTLERKKSKGPRNVTGQIANKFLVRGLVSSHGTSDSITNGS